jgi:hypothetical protein
MRGAAAVPTKQHYREHTSDLSSLFSNFFPPTPKVIGKDSPARRLPDEEFEEFR